ncbi:phage tail protein [[Pasteurella] aerogenes]|nr:phage tail protein [[Pasteurella] aerogenes]
MASLITQQFEQYIAQQTLNHGTVTFDEFIFANIPGLTENNLSEHLTMPNEEYIVHRQTVSQAGIVNENAVVYSVTIGTEIGDFDFNFIGLLNKTQNILAVAIATNPIKKVKNQNNQQGNSITRSILLEFSGAKALTGINVSAETWQIDFTLRLSGIDEKIHFVNRDLYGRAIFFDESFLVKRKQENQFTINAGVAYIEGVRAHLMQTEDIILSLPCSVYVDVVHHCSVTGAYQTEVKFLKAEKQDYIDSAGYQHYVQILADIDASGNVTDRRILSPFLGIKPNDLDEGSVSNADKTGHSHKLPLASLLKKGIVKLYSGTDSDAEDLAATPKAVKGLKALIDAHTRNLTNYIPNSKKSNEINSTSSDTVATSQAVKTAYDKGVEAKTAADNAQKSANAAQATANAKQSPATTLAGYGITDFVVKGEPNTANARNLLVDGIYAFSSGGINLPTGGAYKILNLGGGNGEWRHQLAIKAYSSEIYLSSQVSPSSAEWLPWKRIDGADWSEVRNKPAQATRWPTWNEVTSKPANLVYSSSFSASGGTNNYVSRDGSGDIVARLLRATYNDQSNISGAIAFRVNNSTDNYTRYCNSPAAVRTWLGLHASATRAADWADITNKPAQATRWPTFSEVGSKPTTVSGYGISDFDSRVTKLFTYQKVGNFEIRKYPDGTMIQTYIVLRGDFDGHWSEKSFNWAQAFVGVPLIFTHTSTSYNGSHDAGVTIRMKTTNATCYYWEYEIGGANQGNLKIQFLGIGRWK